MHVKNIYLYSNDTMIKLHNIETPIDSLLFHLDSFFFQTSSMISSFVLYDVFCNNATTFVT